MTRSRKLFVILFLALAVGSSATASADETATDMRTLLHKCTPSCYEKAPHTGPAKTVKVCANLPIHFVQEKRGRGWSKLERSSAMSPRFVPNCKFPTGVPARWKAVVAEARKQLDVGKGDVVTVAADFGDDWAVIKDDFGRITARTVMIDHYSRGHEDYDRCGAGDPFATCEGVNNEVTSFNRMSYRVVEAKRLKQGGKDKECRAAVWDAVHEAVDARKDRDRQIANRDWKTKTYATRYDGLLSEKEMFGKLEARETEARALWTACGGTGEVPLD
jgi:hypothetical protein